MLNKYFFEWDRKNPLCEIKVDFDYNNELTMMLSCETTIVLRKIGITHCVRSKLILILIPGWEWCFHVKQLFLNEIGRTHRVRSRTKYSSDSDTSQVHEQKNTVQVDGSQACWFWRLNKWRVLQVVILVAVSTRLCIKQFWKSALNKGNAFDQRARISGTIDWAQG